LTFDEGDLYGSDVGNANRRSTFLNVTGYCSGSRHPDSQIRNPLAWRHDHTL